MGMVTTRRFFLSFAAQDTASRDLLLGSSKEANLPFHFAEMAIKVPEDGFWRKHCRAKIMQCDALLVFVSENTVHASGVLWEVECARKASIPVYGIRVGPRGRAIRLPEELADIQIHEWQEEDVGELLGSL